jgi:hypothetical protein
VADAVIKAGSPDASGNTGALTVPFEAVVLHVIASDGHHGEHVSVSLSHRSPHWRAMCFIQALFWDAEDVVIQSHPATSEDVNRHEHGLHLWRPVGVKIPTPPKELVGRENTETRPSAVYQVPYRACMLKVSAALNLQPLKRIAKRLR